MPNDARPAIDAVSTMCFSPSCAAIRGRNASRQFTIPPRFTDSTQSQSDAVASAMAGNTPTPAFEHSTSTRPISPNAASASAATASRSATFAGTASTRVP